MYTHEEYEYQGCTIKIAADEDPGNPFKEWDSMPTIVHWHRNYDLGDKYDGPHPDSFEAIQYLRDKYGCTVVLPLYLFDHSGITVRTRPFSCPWDSGQVGFVLMSAEAIEQGWGDHPHPSDEDLVEIIEANVKDFATYLEGGVVGYIVKAPDGTEDSCWGFYDVDDCKGEAQSVAEYMVENEAKQVAGIERMMAL